MTVYSTLECNFSNALFTDKYQFTMAYAYWSSNRHNDFASFDVFFRKNPFNGGFTIFCGIREIEQYLFEYKITDENILELKEEIPTFPDEFLDYLRNITLDDVVLYACDEGSVVFPNEPIITVEGPIAIVQLLETAILNFANFASLVATNAAHFREQVDETKKLMEFGCRRAQGPNGAMTASVYSYVGGFDSTSNLLAGKRFGIPTSGTMAHSFISSFASRSKNSREYTLKIKNGTTSRDLFELVEQRRQEIQHLIGFKSDETVELELEAFIAYACAFPDNFLATIDTYSVMKSGIVNFCIVALAINDCGYRALGIRIDSGDLAYFSRGARHVFRLVAKKYELPWFENLLIAVSNDIGIETLESFKNKKHEVNAFGIGNNLVTCSKQSSLGMVFKLVQINHEPTTKVTEDSSKITIPYRKKLYRFYDKKGCVIMDHMTMCSEKTPICNQKIEARHPYNNLKKSYVIASAIEHMQKLVFKDGKILSERKSLKELRECVRNNLTHIRQDYKLTLDPSTFKVSVSRPLYDKFHNLLQLLNPTIELM